jgi:hypothetical protein
MGGDHLIDMATAPVKQRRPTIAASLRSKLRRKARKPTAANPKLVKLTSAYNGLFPQPMKLGAISPKKVCLTKL